MNHATAFIKCVAILALLAGASLAGSVVIDERREFQTIEGLGCYYAGMSDDQIPRVLDDLGVSAIRLPWGYDKTRDDADAKRKKQEIVDFAAKMKSEAAKRGKTLRFIVTYWTPPAFLKTNNELANGGELKPESRSEFGDSLVSCIRQFKNKGIDLYGISPQNEPGLAIWYVSCVYNPYQYAEMLKVVGPKIKGAYPKVKVFGPDERSGAAFKYYRYMRDRDPEAFKHYDAMAIHGYIDASNPNPAAAGSQLWESFHNAAASNGKSLWMTETSGFDDTWSSTFEYGKGVFAALKYGQLSWSTWWKYKGAGGVNGAKEAFISGGIRWPYYASKLFYTTIRPGAMQIAALGDTARQIYAAAFRHTQKKTLTVILINNATSTQSVTLEGHELPGSLDRLLCDASNKCSSTGTVSAGAGVSLPKQSITALVGSNYDPSYREPATSIVRRAPAVHTNALGACRATRYTIAGRKITGNNRRSPGLGVMIDRHATSRLIVR